MPASAETRAAADLVRAEQLAALGGAQPVAALAGVQPVMAPIDYNVPYSPAPVAPVAPVAPTPISAPAAPAGPGSQNFFGNDPALGLTSQDVPRYSLLEGAEDVASSGNTFPVGAGPFPTLEAGVYGGPGQNYYGNDPTAGLITADAPRYSLLESARDVASSGNTYLVGTGPQPGLGAGVYPVGSYQEGSEGRTVGEHRGLAGLANRGRYGDSMLVHMAPDEVAGLAALTQNGVTINPETGLPEMFNLRSILPTIVGIGAGFLLPPVGAAIASGLATAAVSEGTASERIGKGLLAGIGSWGMGKLTGMLGGAGAAAGGQPGIAAFGADAAATGISGAPPEIASQLISPQGALVDWANIAEAPKAFLMNQGVTSPAAYQEFMKPAMVSLRDMTPAVSAVPQVTAGTGIGSPTASEYGPLTGRRLYKAPGRLEDWVSRPAEGTIRTTSLPAQWHDTDLAGGLDFTPGDVLYRGDKIPRGYDQSLRLTPGPATPSPLHGPSELALQAQSAAFRPLQSSYSPEQLRQVTAGALDPTVKAAQAAAAYERTGLLGERFDLGKRLGYVGEGLGQVDLTSWKPTAPGRLGLGDIATPAAASLAGFGAMLPEEEYKVSGGSTYDDQGPYFPAERRRRRLPPGYIPGVSPQLPYFAGMGGTRGKTVSGGLPTIYAQTGSEPDPGSEGDVSGMEGEMGYGAPTSPGAAGTGIGAADASFMDPHGMMGKSGFVGKGDTGFSGMGGPQADKPASVTHPFAPPPDAITSLMLGFKEASQKNPNMMTAAGLLPGMSGLGLAAALANAPLGSFAAMPGDDPGPGPEGAGGDWQAEEAARKEAADMPGGEEEEEEEGRRMEALSSNRIRITPPASYRSGIDPQFSYFAQRGTEGMTIEENIDVETATEMPAGVAATSGIMQGAPVAVQDDVGARLSERQAEEPQNPRERAIYDRAVLALQNELEPEVAQRAIDEFLEVFGPEALHMLQEMVRGERENGGTVETVSGETTVEEGELQGPDVIAGKIVDPVTGEETANLRVGENEYIEPADSLARRAQVAGLPPTPENGAMIRGEEERMLRQAVG